MNLADYQLMVLDFETFYDTDYTLRKLSTTAYVFDPRFEVIGVGVRFGANRVWMEEHQFRAFAKSVDWSKVALVCHHAQFDGLVLSHHYGVHPAFWLDTLSMARAIHGESKAADLGSLMQYYGVGTKGTEVVQAKGKRRVDFTAEEYAQYGVYCIGDCDGTLGIFLKMIQGYPVPELELIDITVRMYTNPMLKLDEPKMKEYLAWEIARKEELLAKIGADKKDLSSADKFANMLRLLGVDPPMKNSPTAKLEDGSPKQIYAFAKTDPAFQELLLGGENDDIRWLCEARQGVKSVGNETRSARLLDMGRDGRSLPVYLKYAGAGPFRWAGGDKVNWQNFERQNKKDPRKGTIRQSIIAPPGWLLVGGDAAQIEARYNAWYSGETAIVEAFARGEDIYSKFASEIYNRVINRKTNPDDEIPGHVGKTAILGLGYQMGHLKFGSEMLKGANGGAPVQFTQADLHKLGIDPTPYLANPMNVERIRELPSRLTLPEKLIHYTVANYIVNVYRAKNANIKANWKFMQHVIDLMAKGHTGPVGKDGLLVLVKDGILLPSGLVMHYRELRQNEEGEYSYLAKRGQRSKLYGGLLTENWTQASCRIIVSDAMVKLKREGLPHIVSMEHDAIIGLAPEADAPYWSARLLELIATAPSWAPGLPLAAEGGFGTRLADTK